MIAVVRSLSCKESACNAGDSGDVSSIPGSGRSPEGVNGNPLQYACLENPIVLLTLFLMPIILLFTLSTLFATPTIGKAGAKKLEEDAEEP